MDLDKNAYLELYNIDYLECCLKGPPHRIARQFPNIPVKKIQREMSGNVGKCQEMSGNVVKCQVILNLSCERKGLNFFYDP